MIIGKDKHYVQHVPLDGLVINVINHVLETTSPTKYTLKVRVYVLVKASATVDTVLVIATFVALVVTGNAVVHQEHTLDSVWAAL